MNLLTEKTNGAVILYVKEKRLDAHNSGELKVQMLRLAENRNVSIVVDLEEVQFIDSSSLGALLSGHKNVILHGGSLKPSGL
jgi:anti-sigma B factor antagonist